MNRIGFNVLTWSETVSDDLFKTIEGLHSIGYDGIEYAMGAQDAGAYRRLGTFLQELGMGCTCVLALGPDENPASPDDATRSAGLDKIKWTIDRAVDTGADVVCGPFHSAFATFSHAAPMPNETARSADVLRDAGAYAEAAGVTLALEALNRFECYLCNTSDQLVELLMAVDHPRVRAMFDTHHANIEEKSFVGAIKTLAPYLAHVHISENDRGTPGDGHIPFPEVFRALSDAGYDGWLTIEAFTRSDPGFANAIHVWRTFSEPWDIAESGYRFIKQAVSGKEIE